MTEKTHPLKFLLFVVMLTLVTLGSLGWLTVMVFLYALALEFFKHNPILLEVLTNKAVFVGYLFFIWLVFIVVLDYLTKELMKITGQIKIIFLKRK